MGLREAVNKNPVRSAMIGAVVLVLGLAWLIYYIKPSSHPAGAVPERTYYTDDDGKTFFPDGYEKLATSFNGPSGKEAVRAMVCQYGEGKRRVGWMEKYTPRGKQILADYYSNPANKGKLPPLELEAETLYKRPGMTNWASPKSNMPLVAQIRALPRKDDQLPTIVTPTADEKPLGR